MGLDNLFVLWFEDIVVDSLVALPVIASDFYQRVKICEFAIFLVFALFARIFVSVVEDEAARLEGCLIRAEQFHLALA